jgi:hypothetical protein
MLCPYLNILWNANDCFGTVLKHELDINEATTRSFFGTNGAACDPALFVRHIFLD